jgi:putative thiamine transport system substrate-binding protein
MRPIFGLLLALLALVAAEGAKADLDWEKVLAGSRGQTVYWNAWAGDAAVNGYIAWTADQVRRRFGITLVHVKISDTAEAVSRIIAEASAGRSRGGSVDLIWINGENFAALKERDLLYGPFAQDLPNFSLVDTAGKPSTLFDVTLPTDGYEAPWGLAQFVIMADTARIAAPPASAAAMLAWAKEHPGRLAYPQPPDFLGTTFLKQALTELTEDPAVLQKPAADATFAQATAPLWAFLDALHPHLWRAGRSFPQSGPAARQLLADGEVDIAFSFNPAEASAAIAQGVLPDTVRTFPFAAGSIANSHFLAVPANASAPEAALVVTDFLLSPAAQAHKQDPAVWGDFTVLALDRLSAEDRRLFAALPLGVATVPPERLGRGLLEPHPSWTLRLEQEWKRRYSG